MNKALILTILAFIATSNIAICKDVSVVQPKGQLLFVKRTMPVWEGFPSGKGFQ